MTFPYRSYYLPSADVMFENLRDLGIGKTKFVINNTPHGKKLIRTYPEDYESADAISSHFSEPLRMECRALGRSPMKVWQSLSLPPTDYSASISRARTDNEAVYQAGIKERSTQCNLFPAGLAVYLYTQFIDQVSGIRILDPSSGWGDRLIAGLSLRERVAAYHGYDPNKALQPVYASIIAKWGMGIDAWVKPIPFEKATITPRSYDIAMTSPPYWELETYVEAEDDVERDQPTTRYRSLEEFTVGLYRPYLTLMANSVRIGGTVIVYVSNYTKDGKLVDLESLTRTILEEAGARFVSKGLAGSDRPFFVFTIPVPTAPARPLFVHGMVSLATLHSSDSVDLLRILNEPANVAASGRSRSLADIEKMINYSATHPDDLFWTIRIGGKIQGYIGFEAIDQKKPPLFANLFSAPITGLVLEVYLSSAIQGKGWFQYIYTQVVKMKRLSSIWASTYLSNERAQRAFLKVGMKEAGRGKVLSTDVVVFYQ